MKGLCLLIVLSSNFAFARVNGGHFTSVTGASAIEPPPQQISVGPGKSMHRLYGLVEINCKGSSQPIPHCYYQVEKGPVADTVRVWSGASPDLKAGSNVRAFKTGYYRIREPVMEEAFKYIKTLQELHACQDIVEVK